MGLSENPINVPTDFSPESNQVRKKRNRRKEYEFSKGKRGSISPSKGKTRVTIYLDNDVIDAFRTRSEAAGRGYQTLINEALKEYIAKANKPLDATTLRRILREELMAAG